MASLRGKIWWSQPSITWFHDMMGIPRSLTTLVPCATIFAYQPNWFKSVPYNAFRISAVWIRHAVVPRTSSRCLLSQPTTGSKLLAPRRLVAFCLVLYSYRSNSAADQMVALHHDRRQIGRMEEFDRHGILHQERAGRQGNHSNAHPESKHWDDSARL